MLLQSKGIPIIVTAGSNYLDIDAYACCVAMRELFELQGVPAISYSAAPCNYSVCASLVKEGQLTTALPQNFPEETAKYIIVDVSSPEFIMGTVPLERVVAVYDHHTGFEDYWTDRIGEEAHIEFLGAAATLIYREWKAAGLLDRMTRSTALLLIAAILDNTLDLTSANTTNEDRNTFHALCAKENIDAAWCAAYFSEVQRSVEADLEAALLKDVKTMRGHAFLPPRIAQLCVWDADKILRKLMTVRRILNRDTDGWLLNLIDLRRRRSYFVCDDPRCQKEIEKTFDVSFDGGVAVSSAPYLRKEIIARTSFPCSWAAHSRKSI